ncbi:Mu-like prophage major head subunit gpT family protein [Marinobacterium rhizophilum]|uniref:Mu-like prophage major head subunit gpT family protein n=1 Tax=Marinobacterium rhizophilum TaxID=420402 RepID=A0ABY5HPX1_9GAMM|nr:Mu-like prophage major head subunit gpT family protein [Marinobacterium rhizophilum]UTW12936.1 Mu-like prophage major head subunit gpT family protein [Marinobacterium rhizophilum]
MNISPSALKALYSAVNAAFQQGRASYAPLWKEVATLVPSTTAQEDYSWLGEFSRLREWLGDRQVNRLKVYDYSLKNKKFEATEGIPAERIEDDAYGVLMPKFQDMGYAAATHPDELVFALLAAGFSTPCYDGQYFFDTDHPVGEGESAASVSNMQAGSSPAWFLLDTGRPLKPLIFQRRREYRLIAKTDAGNSDHVFMADEYLYGVDARVNAGFGFWQMAFGSKAVLNATNFDAAMAAMGGLKSDKGRPLGIMPKVLVVGPSNRANANAVVAAERLANGGSNTNWQAVEVKVVPWLE